MKTKLRAWIFVAAMLAMAGSTVYGKLLKVEDFDGYTVDTVMNNQVSPESLGGLWDSDDEGDWHGSKAGMIKTDGDDQVLYQEYRWNGQRSICVNGLADPINEGETGVLFFRFKIITTGNPILWNVGVHDLTGDDPLSPGNTDHSSKINAGFRATGDNNVFSLTTLDETQTLLADLVKDQWYSVWIVVDNGADTFDLYVETADGGAGEAVFPTTEPVGVALPFSVTTTNALVGGLWHTANGQYTNVHIDEVWWSGNGAFGNPGAAQSPSPNGSSVSPDEVSSLEWSAPLTKTEVDGDPNLVSVDSFDLYYYSELTANVDSDDPNFIKDVVIKVPNATSPYALSLEHDTTYFWRVDTHVTWDSNEFTGTASVSNIIEGDEWQFSTVPEYIAPVLEGPESVITTLDLMPVYLSANVTVNCDTPISSAYFTLLDTDYEYPVGAIKTFEDTTADFSNPTATLNTNTAGTYKVKLDVTDGTTTFEKVIEVRVYADACQASKDAGDWVANDFDIDDNCVVDILDFADLAKNWLDDTGLDVQENYEGDVTYIPADIFIEAEDPYSLTDPNYVTEAPLEVDTGSPRINTGKDWVSGGKYISHTAVDTFMTYEVDFPEAGDYVVTVSNSFPSGDARSLAFGTVSADGDPSNDDIFAYGEISLADKTGWSDYRTDSATMTFPAGPQLIRVTWIGADSSIDYLTFNKAE